MPRRPGVPPAVALRVDLVDRPEAIAALAQRVAVAGGRVRTLSTVRLVEARDGGQPGAEVEIEVEGLAEADLAALLEEVEDVRKVHPTRVLEGIFGKRIIVIGGGAQVAQVALGAVSEADRHNLRGDRACRRVRDRGRGPGRRRPAAGPTARPRRLDHGR